MSLNKILFGFHSFSFAKDTTGIESKRILGCDSAITLDSRLHRAPSMNNPQT